jgi:hypothetical protein
MTLTLTHSASSVVQAATEKAVSLYRRIDVQQFRTAGPDRQRLIASARSGVGVLTDGAVTGADRAMTWFKATGIPGHASRLWERHGRDWAQTFALDSRPVQIVGGAMIAGFLYVAASDPYASVPAAGPDGSGIVAALIAPVGAVSVDQIAATRVADGSDPDRSPSASVN